MMPTSIRIILISLITIVLTWLLQNAELWHGLIIVILSALATYNLIQSYRLETIIAYALGSLLTITLLGVNHSVGWSDLGIFITIVGLTLLLIDAVLMDSSPLPELITIVVTVLMVLFFNWYWQQTPKPLPIVGSTLKERQFNRIVQAIGSNEDKVKSELEKRFGSYNSDTWKNALGTNIPDSGPWPVSMFFQNIDGNPITTGLWGKNIDQLQIAGTPGSLQPLVQCRIAIRKLMGIEEVVYTPFFKPEDFNAANNSLTAVEDKIYAWTDRDHPDVLKALGCDTKPKSSENLLHWIKECVIPIGGFAKDKELQNIKKVGEQCGVVFISPTKSNTGTTKKMK